MKIRRILQYSRAILLVAACLLVAAPPLESAALSDIDRMSLYGNWEKYVPDDGSCSSGSSVLVGADNIEKAFNYLVGKGLTPTQVAGIIGNLMVEDSGLVPDTVQGGGHAPEPVPGKGYGIAQWTAAGRQLGLKKLAQQEGKPASDLGLQLDYLWQELTSTYQNALDDLKTQTSAQGAADSFMVNFEAPADHVIGGPNSQARGKNANDILARYGGGSNTSSSTSNASCGGAVECIGGGGGTTGGLSELRQKVVCLTQQELDKWTPPPPIPRMGYLIYSDGAQEEWCADFASWIYKQAGYPFTGGSSGGWRLPAVEQIRQLGIQNQGFHYHSGADYTPRPGDLVIHKEGASHVNIVVAVTGTVVTMVGGDQGDGPYGGPNSASVVSKVTSPGFYVGDISGYVSPD